MSMTYGIKAYGHWDEFATKEDYTEYLMDWIANTEGAECDRAVDALVNLRAGKFRTDTDRSLNKEGKKMAKFTVTMEETVVWSTEIEAENAEEARRYCFEHRGEDPDLDSENNPDTAECVDFNVTDVNPVDPDSDDGLHSDD